MKHPIQTFRGFRPFRLDAKRRVSIPPPWRPVGGAALFLVSSVAHGLPMVQALGEDVWHEKVDMIKNSDATPAEKCELLGRLAARSHVASLDDQGRLQIPKNLCEPAGLAADSTVVRVGRYSYFEIWNAENFETAQEIELRESVDDTFGIL